MAKIDDIERAAKQHRHENEKKWRAAHKHRIDNEAYEVAVKFAGQLQIEYGREVTASEAIIEAFYRLNGKHGATIKR